MADDDAEMETLTSPGGRRGRRNNDPSSSNQRRRGLRGLGRGGQGGRRNNNRRSNDRDNNLSEEEQRRIRKWGPRGVMRRIRGKGIPGQEGEKPEGESLLTEGDEGFYDKDPYGDMDGDYEESRPITGMGADDEDDFLDPSAYIDYSQNEEEEEEDEEVCGDDSEDDSGSEEEGDVDGDEEEDDDDDDDEYEEVGKAEDGQWGRYDDEFENRTNEDSSSYRDGGGPYHDDGGYNNSGGSYHDGDGGEGYTDGGGYNDGEYRQDYGSPRNKNGGGRNRGGGLPRTGLLRQLSKIRRPGRRGRGRNSSSNLDHTNLIGSGSSDPYWNQNSNVSGRIEGFGSKPEVEQHRNLRQKLKKFRDKRIAARNGEGGMKRMSTGGDPVRGKSFIERIDNVIDAMADAALTHPGFDGYMTSSGRTVTQTSKNTTTGNAKESYLRTQFGDDNAYIIYLEGEKVASELEVTSYKNRIKELEVEVRKLKRIVGDDSSDSNSSAASDDSSNAAARETDEKESEIEWQTGVPEEGVLIDIEGTTTASSIEQTTETAPVADLLQTALEVQIKEKQVETREVPMLSAPVEEIEEEDTLENSKETTSTQSEGVLVDLTVRDKAKDIVDNILAGLLNERKVTSLLNEDEGDVADSLLNLQVEQSVDQSEDGGSKGRSDSPPEPPTDAPPESSTADPPPPPAVDPPELPADAPPASPTDDPPPPPAVDPPELPADAPPASPTDAPPPPPAVDRPPPPTNEPPEPPADAGAPEATSDTESTTTPIVKSEE